MNSLEKLEKKYNFNTNELIEILPNYYKYTSTIDNPAYEPFIADIHFTKLINYLAEILEIAAKELKIEGYELYGTEEREIVPKVGFVTKDLEFTIGLFREFYIIWEIKNPNAIKDMKDEFWMLLFEWSTLGKFQFKENDVNLPNLRKKHPDLFNNRSNFFKLFRNYYLTQIEYKSTRQLGFIRLTWDENSMPTEIVSKLLKAIEIINKLNKMLSEK
ncbi:hypothetical protein [Flavobacterium sp.]|uniref:hypothetical protein n=2 Tax=Flavobacterium sp. TaxID=239 RepID=UPI0040348387